MNLTSFRYFTKVAERMSFTKAAEELYISQQSVSSHVKRLEDEYHVELFERRPTLKLTPAGETFLLFAREMIAADEMLCDQLNTFNTNYYGTITIGLPQNRTNAFAREFVPAFTKRFPNMMISLYEKPSSILMEAVLQNEVDLALILTPSAQSALDPLVYRYRVLADEPLYAVVSDNLLQTYLPEQFPACKETFRTGVSVETLRKLPLFVRPSSSHTHRQIVEHLRDKGFQPNILVQSASTSAMMPLCAHGYGVIFCTPMVLRLFTEEYAAQIQHLNIFPIKQFEHCHQAMLVWHKSKYLSTPIKESMGIIQEIFDIRTS